MGPTPPPPYYANAPKKTSTTTIVLVILGVCAVCCVLGVLGVGGLGLWGFNKAKNFAACTFGAVGVGQAIHDYAADHHDKLPDAAKWQDEVAPYFAKIAEKQQKNVKFIGTFDPNGVWGCKDESGPGMTGLAFNSTLSGKKLSDIQDQDQEILLFEVPESGHNLNQPYHELPEDQSPKIMNSPRGWLKVTVDGQVVSKGRKTTVNYQS